MVSVVAEQSVTVHTWAQVFPFVDDFGGVVRGEISMMYVESLKSVLKVVVDSNLAVQRASGFTAFTLRVTVAAVAALQRCELVLARRALVESVLEGDAAEVTEYFQCLWDAVVDRDRMMLAELDRQATLALDPVIAGIWRFYASSQLCTVGELYGGFSGIMEQVRFKELSGLWVESSDGVAVSDMSRVERLLPVVSLETYRVLMCLAKGIVDDKVGLVSVDGDCYTCCLSEVDGPSFLVDLGHGYVDSSVVLSWLWTIVTRVRSAPGTCYLQVVHPSHRRLAHSSLGSYPTVSRLGEFLDVVGASWTSVEAKVVVGDVLHIAAPGAFDRLGYSGDLAVGADARMSMATLHDHEDRYAKALVDEFVSKHRPVDSYVAPVHRQMVPLTLDTSAPSGVRRFSEVADMLYESVGKVLSPGTRSNGRIPFDVVAGLPEHALVTDDDRLLDLRMRLAEGSAIRQSYFESAFRRRFGARWRPRPKIHESTGRGIHVFAGFPANSGTTIGVWKLDDSWDVTGWTSYLARFPRHYDDVLSFVSPVSAQDVRMDCTGSGSIDFGDCKVTIDDTVLWFSDSVKFRLRTTSHDTALRISIPDTGQVSAIGTQLRRYLRISGYVVVLRCFDIPPRVSYTPFAVERDKRNVGAGCHIYAGSHHFDRGRYRLRLTGVSSSAPMKLLVAASPANALDSVEWEGVRVYATPLDYAGLLVDNLKTLLIVALSEDADVSISGVQIVDVAAYDVAVRATSL